MEREFLVIREIYARFSHRLTYEVHEKIKHIIFESEYSGADPHFDDPNFYVLRFQDNSARKFMTDLLDTIEKEEKDILERIKVLESVSKSFWKKLRFNLRFWSDVS